MGLPAPAPVYYTRRIRDYVKELWRRREFIWYLAIGNFKARNASTALGLFWWVLNPLLLSLVYYLVFGLVFPGRRDILYVMSGMFAFHFTSQSFAGSAGAVLQNSKLLVNVRFPRVILPISHILESALGFLLSLGILVVAAVGLNGSFPGSNAWLLILAIPLHFLFNLGLGSLAARLAIPFRDVTNVIPYINRIWLYLSPIIWPLSLLEDVGPEYVRLAEANPMFSIIGVYRAALLNYEFYPSMLVQFAAWSIGIAIVGLALFIPFEGKMARYL